MNVKPPTILTNLQRGNVKQENPMLQHQRTIHELAAQGELYNIEPHLVDSSTTNNMTPLLWAAGYGQSSTVEFLIRLGSNPNHKADGGKTALMLAAAKGFFHVVRILLSNGANINEVDDSGNTALMYAAHQDQALVIQELLKSGADLGLANIHKQTAYSLAMNRRNKPAQASIEAHLITLFKGHSSRHWH